MKERHSVQVRERERERERERRYCGIGEMMCVSEKERERWFYPFVSASRCVPKCQSTLL